MQPPYARDESSIEPLTGFLVDSAWLGIVEADTGTMTLVTHEWHHLVEGLGGIK